jgi:hypothetical protein
MTASQANLLLLEVGIVAASALVTLTGTLRGLWKVKQTAETVKDVAEEAVGRL